MMNDKNYQMLRQGADCPEKTIDSKTVFRERILNLRIDEVVLPDGGKSAREVVEHSGAVVILPVLPGGNLLFVKQFRHAVSDFLLELPAGKLDHENEDITDCARRELLEETHYSCEKLEKMITFYTSPGFCNEKIHLFIADGLSYNPQKGLSCDEDEFISIADFSLNDSLKMIDENKISDAKTILGILYYSTLAKNKVNILKT